LEQLEYVLLILFESPQWLIGDIKSWVIFVSWNSITNENLIFNENESLISDLGSRIWANFFILLENFQWIGFNGGGFLIFRPKV
jgi:hypothetical protein